MRIICGKYGHRRFQLPPSFGARPTTDFAKENLFNVLENLTEWAGSRALDLFAGTGSIAFELLSRGCSSVTAVEQKSAHASFITRVGECLGTDGLHLIRGDVFRYLRSVPVEPFNLIFADPPYTLPNISDLPGIILSDGWLHSGGIFVLEHSRAYDFSGDPYFMQVRTYGSVHFSIFTKD
jgi:16S rRNA (guanine(966)-N(2))-methyltransferase RsmD